MILLSFLIISLVIYLTAFFINRWYHSGEKLDLPIPDVFTGLLTIGMFLLIFLNGIIHLIYYFVKK